MASAQCLNVISGCLRAILARNSAGFDRKSRGFPSGSARFWRARRAHRLQNMCNHLWKSVCVSDVLENDDFQREKPRLQESKIFN